MKLSHLLGFLLICCFSISVSAQKNLPDVTAKTLDGQTVNLKEFGENGKITVVSFWATWCSPCKKELDAIADLYEEWQEDYNAELVAITIDTRRAVAKVPAIVETKGWEYTILHGNEEEMRSAFNFQTIPQTYLVDQEGNIVYIHNGYSPGDEEDLGDKIAKLAGK